MIFLEAPAGVGFSYDTVKNYSSSDDDVSKIPLTYENTVIL